MQLKNYFLRYFPNQYKTQQRCDEAILENAETLKYVPTATKIKKCVKKPLKIILMH